MASTTQIFKPTAGRFQLCNVGTNGAIADVVISAFCRRVTPPWLLLREPWLQRILNLEEAGWSEVESNDDDLLAVCKECIYMTLRSLFVVVAPGCCCWYILDGRVFRSWFPTHCQFNDSQFLLWRSAAAVVRLLLHNMLLKLVCVQYQPSPVKCE